MHNNEVIPHIDIHSHNKENEIGLIRIHNLMVHEFRSYMIIPGAHYSLGVHPWYIEKTKELPAPEIFQRKEIVAIGETGLDKLRGPDIDIQEKVFRHHIEISEALHKPLIIHNVRMTDRMQKIHNEVKPKSPWILHAFTGNSDQVRQLITNNFYFSFSERALKSQKSIDAFRIIPLDRIFMETDEGEADIEFLYDEYCKLYDLEINNLKHFLYSNFKFVFQK